MTIVIINKDNDDDDDNMTLVGAARLSGPGGVVRLGAGGTSGSLVAHNNKITKVTFTTITPDTFIITIVLATNAAGFYMYVLSYTGLMDNGKIPYEGLEMAEGGVPFLKKEDSKTTPRPTKASLPSPPLSSAMEALNKKVEQLMAENKRLEKAIFGPPTEPAKARKPAKQKSVEGARAMNLEDLRAMGGVQRMAERDMERYGAMDQSSDSDSNTERDDSDGLADKDRRRKDLQLLALQRDLQKARRAAYAEGTQRKSLSGEDVAHFQSYEIGVDLFTLDNKEYLITVDYFSNFWEVDRLHSTTASNVILKLKNHFARYGCPDRVISDNGPQFTSDAFASFSKAWDFEHRTSSPGNSKANGKAESAVKTAKRLLRKALDAGTEPYLAILEYRNTPTQGMESSPTQRLMNRRTRTLLPTTNALLQPRVVYPETVKDLNRRKQQQSVHFNRNARDLPTLDEGDTVRMKPFRLGEKRWKKATVTSRLDERSYVVETPEGDEYRRNRFHLKKTSENPVTMATADVEYLAETEVNICPKCRTDSQGAVAFFKGPANMTILKMRAFMCENCAAFVLTVKICPKCRTDSQGPVAFFKGLANMTILKNRF
ncbi:hypothetical protein QZH41_005184 [Actinostola sp. cb2023]|nr:hypothetical protein QZH41_005184 [Actinostola sp. cb2023]